MEYHNAVDPTEDQLAGCPAAVIQYSRISISQRPQAPAGQPHGYPHAPTGICREVVTLGFLSRLHQYRPLLGLDWRQLPRRGR